MLIEMLGQRHDYFAAADAATLSATASRIAQAANDIGATTPPGVLRAVQTELTYATLRHRRWLGAPLFVEVLTDLAATDFGLERGTARRLAQAAARDGAAPSVSDRDFVRYIFVASATASNEAALIHDLGIGRALIQRIRRAVETAVAPKSEAVATFLPELDATIAEVLCEIARDAKSVPWVLQIHRLRYHVLSTMSLNTLPHIDARLLFDFLLAIGARDGLPENRAEQKLRRLGIKAATSIVLRELQAASLVYPEACSRQKRRWTLSSLAQEMTAEAFAHNHVMITRDPVVSLSKHCEAYQAAIIQAWERPTATALRTLARHQRPLAPAALHVALRRLLDLEGEPAVREVTIEIAQHDLSPWLRKAACQALSKLSPSRDVGQILAEVARSDASPTVRAIAQRCAAFGAVSDQREHSRHERDVKLEADARVEGARPLHQSGTL